MMSDLYFTGLADCKNKEELEDWFFNTCDVFQLPGEPWTFLHKVFALNEVMGISNQELTENGKKYLLIDEENLYQFSEYYFLEKKWKYEPSKVMERYFLSLKSFLNAHGIETD